MINNQLYPKTLKYDVKQTALTLGCKPTDINRVWWKMGEYDLPLNHKGFIYTVANAMQSLGMRVDDNAYDRLVERSH